MSGTNDQNPHDAHRGDGRRPWGEIGAWVLPVGVIIFVVIAIGAVRLAIDRSATLAATEEAPPTAQPLNMAPTTEPELEPTDEPEPMEVAWFVDIRTGELTLLPESILSIPTAKQFAVSPEGERLAFAAGGAIYVARIDGERVRKVATTPGASAPSWSADGDQIVYSDYSALFVIDLNGHTTEEVFSPARGPIWRPSFSPDGLTIMFTMDRRNSVDLWTVPAHGGEGELWLRDGHSAAFGAYGPDGRVAYRRTSFNGVDITEMTEGTVWIAEADGTDQQALGRFIGSMSQVDPKALWPAWSPDGSTIAFERLYERGVFLVDVSTEEVTRLLDAGRNPTWVDDHTLIVERNYPFP